MNILSNRFFSSLVLLNIIERFSYYGIQSFFVLYLIEIFGFSQERTYDLYGVFFTLVYTLPLLVGYYIRHRENYVPFLKGVFICLMIGFACVAIHHEITLYIGMTFIIFGGALFKVVSPALLGRFYDQNKSLSRDSGFTYLYIFMNVGTLFSPIFTGYVGLNYGWSTVLFILAGLSFFSIFMILKLNKRLAEYDFDDLVKKTEKPLSLPVKAAFVLLLGAAIQFLFFFPAFFNVAFASCFIIMMVWCLRLLPKLKETEKDHVKGIFIMLFFFVTYLGFFEQKTSSLNMFVHFHIDRMVSNFEVPTTWFQSINPFVVVIGGSLIAGFWAYLAKIKKEPNIALKFAISWIIMGVSYWFFYIMAADALENIKTGMSSLILGYILISVSEVACVPLISSMVTRSAPKHMKTVFLGLVTYAGAASHFLAAQIAKITSIDAQIDGNTVDIYHSVYFNIVIVSIIIGVLFFILGKRYKRYFEG